PANLLRRWQLTSAGPEEDVRRWRRPAERIQKGSALRWKKYLLWFRRPWSGKLMKGRRILAIDHGSKRIGFALSDELGWTAQPLETYHRRNPEADIRHIQGLVREHEVSQVL